MTSHDRPEQSPGSTVTSEFSMSNFIQDVCDKGVVTAVAEHPMEAAVGAVGAAAVGAAAIYVARGKAVTALLGVAKEDLGSSISMKLDLGAAARSAARESATSGLMEGGERQAARATVTHYGGARIEPSQLKPVGDAIVERTSGAKPYSSYTNRPLSFYDSGSKTAPMRRMAQDMQTGIGPTLKGVEGPSRIVFGEDNSIQHILYNRKSSVTERADLMLQAAYAGLIKIDALAAAAASKVEGEVPRLVAQRLERAATPAQIQTAALDGARAYVKMDPRSANPFTSFLTERMGPMNSAELAWGRHIITEPHGPASVWKLTFPPAPENLVKGG